MVTVEEFINENIELIDNNEWEEIYKKAVNELEDDVGKFTEIMLEADIHPENYVTELPKCFLFKSDVTSFEIPDSITSIGSFAFSGCTNLNSITIPNSVINISSYAFYECDSLTNVIIGNSVESIGKHAFQDCRSLTDINIPSSVKRIDQYAFLACSKDLVINYNGTKAQFDIITEKKFRNEYFIVRCIDGDIVKKR